MYADESGDIGVYDTTAPIDRRGNSYFIVSGLVVAAEDWGEYLDRFYNYRRFLKTKYNLPVRTELKGREFFYPTDPAIKAIGGRKIRFGLYGDILTTVAQIMPNMRIISGYLNKIHPQRPYMLSVDGIFERVWSSVLERYNMCLVKDHKSSLGMVIPDEGEEVKLRKLQRKMRVFHYAGSHFGGSYSAPLTQIVEDPVMRASHHSYFVQIADLAAHALYRKLYPKGSHRKYNTGFLYDKLRPIINLNASRKDPHGLGIIHC